MGRVTERRGAWSRSGALGAAGRTHLKWRRPSGKGTRTHESLRTRYRGLPERKRWTFCRLNTQSEGEGRLGDARGISNPVVVWAASTSKRQSTGQRRDRAGLFGPVHTPRPKRTAARARPVQFPFAQAESAQNQVIRLCEFERIIDQRRRERLFRKPEANRASRRPRAPDTHAIRTQHRGAGRWGSSRALYGQRAGASLLSTASRRSRSSYRQDNPLHQENYLSEV